jgi:transcriptional regulator with GAF, ATPase, and Fis domain
VPPLRERPEDIPLLVKHHLTHVERRLGKTIRTIPTSVMQAFQRYAWPGNVRELETVVERAVLATRGDTLHLPEAFQESALTSTPSSSSESTGSPATPPLAAMARRGTLEEVERDYIQQILEACYWRIAGPKGAAVILGLNPSTLRARLRKLGLQRPSD